MNTFRQSFPVAGAGRGVKPIGQWSRPIARLVGLFIGIVALLEPFLLGGCARSTASRNTADASDPQAEQLAGNVIKAIGGRRAINHLRYLHFDFVMREGGREILRRSHWLDRKTGRCRLEGKMDGRPYVVLFNNLTHEGRALEMFQPIPAAKFPAMLKQAELSQAGDAFWLLGVARLRDPEARLSWEGENPVAGNICPTLGFQPLPGFGLDPRDHISFYIHPGTLRPIAWTFTLGSDPNNPQNYLWKSWQRVGNCELPVEFMQIKGSRTVRIENLYAPGEIEPRVFFEF